MARGTCWEGSPYCQVAEDEVSLQNLLRLLPLSVGTIAVSLPATRRGTVPSKTSGPFVRFELVPLRGPLAEGHGCDAGGSPYDQGGEREPHGEKVERISADESRAGPAHWDGQ